MGNTVTNGAGTRLGATGNPMDLDRLNRNVAVYAEDLKGNAGIDVPDQLFNQKVDWVELIKSIRQIFGVNIFHAEAKVLQHEGWRRFCENQINNDSKCRKAALSHKRLNGANSLIRRDGERLAIAIIAPP